MNKDVFNFAIAGLKHSENFDFAISVLKNGESLTLVHEMDNKFDKNAVALYFDNMKLGYVPNSGISCSQCWSKVSLLDFYCNKCSASRDSFVQGSLGTRFLKLGLINQEYYCYISENDGDSKILVSVIFN